MTSYADFGKETTATEVAQAFSKEITGKTVLITGVSLESLGLSAALAIASQDPELLILASRTEDKLNVAAEKIRKAFPSVSVRTVILDLASQKSIIAAASEISDSIKKLDILINNAASMTPKRAWTQEHIELQFGTNHIGHFLLTNLLLPKMIEAAKTSAPGLTRIVNVSSLGARMSPVRFSDWNLERQDIPDDEKPPSDVSQSTIDGVDGYPGFLAYAQSKTANILFSVELTKRLQSKGIISFSLHPGSIWTDLSRNLDEEGVERIKKTSKFWKNQDQGSATSLVAAFDPSLQPTPGAILSDCQFIEAWPHATSPENAARLWRLSEQLTNHEFNY